MSIKTHISCDYCSAAAETETPEYGGYARLPGDWVRASLDGGNMAVLDLCYQCYTKLSLVDVRTVYLRNKAERKK